MANIFILPADVFLYILSYLDIHDRIAFALTCRIFGRICVDANIFRNMDLSRSPISAMQRRALNMFFRDKQLTQHIRELNVSNLRIQNWQMDDQLEEFLISICPHLEALHLLDCGISFQRLHRVLNEAPNLTSLSWSIWDFTFEDIEFLLNSIESSEINCLKNVKHLHLDIPCSESHILVAKYLVLSCCRDLEELKIYVWWREETYSTALLSPHEMIPGFSQPPVENELQNLHSLVVVPAGVLSSVDLVIYEPKLSDFVMSILSKKSSSAKCKKLWISPSISRRHLADLSHLHESDFQFVEAITTNPGWSVDEVKAFFQRIVYNTVRSLHLCLPDYRNSNYEPISRVSGHSLKFLHLSVHNREEIPAERNLFIHSLFVNCSNITELDLVDCCFQKNICKHLSELKYLRKVQLRQCAVGSKYNRRNQVEISETNLWIFVENCKNITHFDVRECCHDANFSSSAHLSDNDLLALAKLRKLKSLTLYNISGITEWTFLKHILEHCKFLTTLRISDFNNFHVPVLMESSWFLQHLSIRVDVPVLGSEVFWNFLAHANNLQRLCIRCSYSGLLNIPVAVKTIKSLPRLHVLHVHSNNIDNVVLFYEQLTRMLEEKECDSRFSFELVTTNRTHIWISLKTGYSLISKEALPLNEAELCLMRPILDIPRI